MSLTDELSPWAAQMLTAWNPRRSAATTMRVDERQLRRVHVLMFIHRNDEGEGVKIERLRIQCTHWPAGVLVQALSELLLAGSTELVGDRVAKRYRIRQPRTSEAELAVSKADNGDRYPFQSDPTGKKINAKAGTVRKRRGRPNKVKRYE